MVSRPPLLPLKEILIEIEGKSFKSSGDFSRCPGEKGFSEKICNSVASCDAGRSSSLSALALLWYRIVFKREESCGRTFWN